MPLVASNEPAKYQASYLMGRLEDMKIIVERLGRQNARLIILSYREDNLMPQLKPRQFYSKKLQIVLQERNSIVTKMRIDLETLYIYGNLILDYWASIVGFIYSLPGLTNWQHPYTELHSIIVSANPPLSLQTLITSQGNDIFWLNYNLRLYRNGFIEHLDRPVQRGASTPTYRLGFSFHIPVAVGQISATEKARVLSSIAHIAPQFTQGKAPEFWQRQPELVLQWMFHGIDMITNHSDRKLVSDVWRKLGGETVSYDILITRLLSLLVNSAQTLNP
jgi:hypothetical protein